MNIKTFTAEKMSDALAKVKRELGSQAVILHTRTYHRGGLLGLGAKAVVEVTAADGREMGRMRSKESASTGGTSRGPSARNRAAHAVPQTAGDLIRRTYAAAQADFAARHTDHSGVELALGSGRLNQPAQNQLADEMRSVKRLVGQMLRQQHTQRGRGSHQPRMPQKLFDQYLHLLEQEVAEELATDVTEQVLGSLSQEQLQDESQVSQAVLQAVAGLIPTDEQADHVPPTADGRPRTIALIGPTGVGKTTTIAKLAANFKLKQKRHVGLVTLDTYRIAAVDQLQTYADIIGVPLQVVASPEELLEALRRCAQCDVVLIDTAGRSPKDDPKLEQLATLIQAANPHEVHLVLSSTCTQGVLLEAVERFGKIRTDRIIFTKLDEAVGFGVLLNVAQKVNKRLSFVTTGQEVPHQIEPGCSQRLAALVLGQASLTTTGQSTPVPASSARGRRKGRG